MLQVPALLVALLSASTLGCGGSDGGGTTAQQLPSSAPTSVPTTATPTPAQTTPTATGPSTVGSAPSTSTPTTGTGESGPGGAGDEEPARTPAAFTIGPGGIAPQTITVPAFLAVDVALTAEGGAQRVTIAAPGGQTVDVAPGGTRHVVLDGLKPGDYAVTTATGARGTLHVVRGGDPGP
jgi:hypothetical protein